jgi:hypothetical protein
MNDFRDRVFAGKAANDSLLRSKKAPRAEVSRAAEEKSLAQLAVHREELRQANHRDGDRHRLIDEAVEIVRDGRRQTVTLVNLSGGGAMIEGAEGLKLWDRVELRLAEWSHVEAAVRWICGQRFGLEFAHETRIDADEKERNDLLRAVILRCFPHVAGQAEPKAGSGQAAAAEICAVATDEEQTAHDEVERDLRHPLIWSGLVHYDHDSIPVRLRNISAGGTMIECEQALRVGAELLLDLGDAGTIFANVNWTKGDAAGLKFNQPFDLQRLAAARPKVASQRWVMPDYLRDDRSGNSPWASHWGRADIARLHRSLGPSSDKRRP